MVLVSHAPFLLCLMIQINVFSTESLLQLNEVIITEKKSLNSSCKLHFLLAHGIITTYILPHLEIYTRSYSPAARSNFGSNDGDCVHRRRARPRGPGPTWRGRRRRNTATHRRFEPHGRPGAQSQGQNAPVFLNKWGKNNNASRCFPFSHHHHHHHVNEQT